MTENPSCLLSQTSDRHYFVIIFPETSTQIKSEPVISIPVATVPSLDIPVTSSMVTSTEMSVITSAPVISTTAHAQPMDPVSINVTPTTSSVAPPSVSRPRPSSTTTYRPTLREVMQKVDRDRRLMFEIPVIPHHATFLGWSLNGVDASQDAATLAVVLRFPTRPF